ncbi:MAG: URC4/urg3 family protein [Burkholderiales bacterium]|nr:URC4/urg3 family protein [Burkholderiales bacterium]
MNATAGAKSSTPATQAALRELRSTTAVRKRAHALLARARAGESTHFWVGDDATLERAAQLVAEVTRERYGDGPIPYHSRWRHFEAGGIDRRSELDRLLGEVSTHERARTQIDLTVVSVLLDAGAGAHWSYTETASGQRFARSEGLGVASFRAFVAGVFSSDPAQPLRADAAGLRAVTAAKLAEAFQVSEANPLIGLEGRVTLLHRLSDALARQPAVFPAPHRPSALFDVLCQTGRETIPAHDVLVALLDTLSEVWPAPNRLADGTSLGDCWRFAPARGDGVSDGWMPFHKLSQWLSYSLLEPFEWAGITVDGLDALTGLPEYRNGGLLLDANVLLPKSPATLSTIWQVSDEFIIEWRALTVALLDELAPRVRGILGRSDAEMPLACVLEGGTWAAGRVLAARLRGGLPPVQLASDATVF